MALSEVLLSIISGIVFLIAVFSLFKWGWRDSVPDFIVAFLLSPAGIPAIAGWLVDRLDDAGLALRGFIARG